MVGIVHRTSNTLLLDMPKDPDDILTRMLSLKVIQEPR